MSNEIAELYAKITNLSNNTTSPKKNNCNIYNNEYTEREIHHMKSSHLFSKPKAHVQNPLFLTKDNIGYKILRKQGWKYDKGIGKDEQGIRDPIKARIKCDFKGIGSKPSKVKEENIKILKSGKEIAKEAELEREWRKKAYQYFNG